MATVSLGKSTAIVDMIKYLKDKPQNAKMLINKDIDGNRHLLPCNITHTDSTLIFYQSKKDLTVGDVIKFIEKIENSKLCFVSLEIDSGKFTQCYIQSVSLSETMDSELYMPVIAIISKAL
jgi:hypothetical protein